MADPDLISWLKPIIETMVSGGVLTAMARFFIVKPLEEAKRERDEYKKLWKDEQTAREKRIEAAETALYGRPSMRYREELPTLSMLVESTPKRQREEELQRQVLAERAPGQPPAMPLAGMRPPRIPTVREEYAPGVRPTDPAPKGYPQVKPPKKR
jgi:hypothetical protein